MKKFDSKKYTELVQRRVESCNRYHNALMALGVKAYRGNDGWVDRENNAATFFRCDRSEGYNYVADTMETGDLIFIGSHDIGGWLCYVENVTRDVLTWKCQFIILSQVDKSLWEQ